MHPFIHATLRALSDLAQPAPSSPDAPPKLDPVQLVLHASIPVKAVLVILVVFSVACWLVIGAKALHLAARARRVEALREGVRLWRGTSTSWRRGSPPTAGPRSRASSRSATTR